MTDSTQVIGELEKIIEKEEQELQRAEEEHRKLSAEISKIEGDYKQKQQDLEAEFKRKTQSIQTQATRIESKIEQLKRDRMNNQSKMTVLEARYRSSIKDEEGKEKNK